MPSVSSLALGLPLMACSCLAAATGLLLIKASGEYEAERPLFCQRPRWWSGFLLLALLASVLDMVVYGQLPLCMVAPFAGLTIVFTLLLASSGLVLREREVLSYPPLTLPQPPHSHLPTGNRRECEGNRSE